MMAGGGERLHASRSKAGQARSQHPLARAIEDHSNPNRLELIAAAIDRLADVVEKAIAQSLGGERKPRYKAAPPGWPSRAPVAAVPTQIGGDRGS